MFKARITGLTQKLDDVLSVRLFLRTMLGLSSALAAAFAIGSFTLSPMPSPVEKLTGKVMAQVSLTMPEAEPEKLPVPTNSGPEIPANTLEPHDQPPPTDQAVTIESVLAEDDKPHSNPTEDALAGLYEVTPYGSLPVIRESDAMTPFKAYQPDFVPKNNSKFFVALVMVDFGLSEALTKDTIVNLPSAISFVASPYGSALQPKITGARSYGHEIWMELPMQGKDFGKDDPGPVTLLAGLVKAQNETRMKTIMGKATGYVGAVSIVAPDFSTAPQGLENIMAMLAKRGLGFAVAAPDDASLKPLAQAEAMPFAQSDMWLDHATDKQSLTAALTKLESLATGQKVAVAFFHPYPALFDQIREWKKTLPAKDIELVPLSTAIRLKSAPQ